MEVEAEVERVELHRERSADKQTNLAGPNGIFAKHSTTL